jgi:hypothetical protein
MGGRIPAPHRVRYFPLGEDALQKAVAVTADRRFDAINVRGIHSDADNICRHVPSKA